MSKLVNYLYNITDPLTDLFLVVSLYSACDCAQIPVAGRETDCAEVNKSSQSEEMVTVRSLPDAS